MFDLYYHTSKGSLENIFGQEDGEALLTYTLNAAWEEPASSDMGFIIMDTDKGAIFCTATVVKIFSDYDGIFEIYRPTKGVCYVRATYMLTDKGGYDHTEVVEATYDPTH